VRGAVVERLLNDGALTALVPSGAFFDSVPDEKPIPFVVLFEFGPRQRLSTSEAEIETSRLRLLAFAFAAGNVGDPNPAEAVVDRAEALLDRKHADLGVDGQAVISCRLTNRRLTEEKERIDDRRVYSAQADVLVRAQRAAG
jgi:hypothetical protein